MPTPNLSVFCTDTLLSVVGQGAPVAGQWLQVKRDGRTHIPINISITAGTATFVIEGRNNQNDTPVTLATGTAGDELMVQGAGQIRARLSAAAGATVLVTTDKALQQAF